MQYEWNEIKRRQNIRKHGIDFIGCAAVFTGFALTFEDNRFDYQEQRFKTLGFWQGRVVSVIHTEATNTIRIISIRKATSYEQKIYFKALGNGLGPNRCHERRRH